LSVKSSLGTVLILAKPKISESNVYIDGMWTPRYGFYRSGQKYSMITCNTPSQRHTALLAENMKICGHDYLCQ